MISKLNIKKLLDKCTPKLDNITLKTKIRKISKRCKTLIIQQQSSHLPKPIDNNLTL